MNTSSLVEVLQTFVSSSIIGGVVSLIIAKQQFKHLEITYRQKLNDNLLQNTRLYIDTLYIPINESLSKLEDSYKTYKWRKARLKSMMRGKVKISPPLSRKETKAKVQSMMPVWSNLTEEALDDLRKACYDFRHLMEDITGQDKDIYLSREFDERLRSFTQFLKAAYDDSWSIASTAITIKGNLRIDKKDFEKRFLADIRYLKSFIKEIALGTIQGIST